jgi:hypothetical protein
MSHKKGPNLNIHRRENPCSCVGDQVCQFDTQDHLHVVLRPPHLSDFREIQFQRVTQSPA